MRLQTEGLESQVGGFTLSLRPPSHSWKPCAPNERSSVKAAFGGFLPFPVELLCCHSVLSLEITQNVCVTLLR